jgi:hypothetical protein
MGFGRCIAALGLLLFILGSVSGQGQILLIDRSGSMQPYFRSGLISEVGQRINNLMRSPGLNPVRVGGFNSRVDLVDNLNAIQASGPTYLDVALDYAVNNQYSLVWLVTDNIMHRAGEEEGQTQAFYDRLKQQSVSRVVVFPLKQTRGQNPGIIVYALLLSPSADDVFRREIDEFARTTTNTVLLPMKPLDRETIETTFVDDRSDKKAKTVYEVGSVIEETMELRFKSRFQHLKIVDADIENPAVAPEFSKNSLLAYEQDQVTITPTKIEKLEPGRETLQAYRVNVHLGKIRLKRDFISLWRAALKDPNEEISLDLSFSVKVPRERFQFSDDFLRDYSSPTPEAARAEGKIYALHQLPLLVAENNTSIQVPHKPKIYVRYPWWLVLIFPGVPIAAAIAVASGGVFAWRGLKRATSRKPQWAIEITSPVGARAEIQRGLVLVSLAGKQLRLGQVKGNSFGPAAGVLPRETHAIKEGIPLSLTSKRNNFVLIFRRRSQSDNFSGRGRRSKRNGKGSTAKI